MTWGYGLAALAYAGLAAVLARQAWRQAGSSRSPWAALAAVVLTSAWALAAWGAALGAVPLGLSLLLDVARYGAWFAFIVWLFRDGPRARAPRWMGALAVALPLSVAALLLWPLGMETAAARTQSLLVAFMLLAITGLVFVEQLLRNLPEDSLWSAKPIGLGLLGGFAFDLYLFSQGVLFQAIDADAWSVRGLLHAAFAPLLWLSASRHRQWVSKIRVSRQVVFHSAALLLAGGYLIFIAAVGYSVRFLGSDWGRALQLALVFAGAVLLLAVVLSRSLRARLRVWLGKHFFRYRYDYREEWLRFTQTLSQQSDPQALGLNAIKGLADMVESPGGALWLRRADEADFRQLTRWNMPATAQAEPGQGALADFIRRTAWVIDLDELRRAPERYQHLRVPDWLAVVGSAWLIVPLWVGQELMGFVVLARSRTPMDLNWEVTDLLKTAARQAASFLAQMQATEALLEARKFEAFSRMSAFVVHDLKNIVTQLSLMMKNAKRLSHNPEFQADMLMTVENSLERMRQLMLQLREGAAPGDAPVGVDLTRLGHELVESAARRGRRLELQGDARVATRGHPERLTRVLGHLVSNALEATEPPQRVWLSIERFGSHARVEVGDNGSGMSEEFVRERLFKPFQTTKAAGMGIGAYESFQYVQELGGKVSVDSAPGRGTVVTLLLPLFEIQTESDLHPLGEA